MKKLGSYLPVICLVLATLWLRLANLGYSDYQGDEIQTLAQPALGQSWLDFIILQRRGPTQFLIARLIYLVDPSFASQFLARLPFALAGVLAVFIFYEMLKLHTEKRIAFYAALFFSINGLFVGLTRIVQYQPFVLLFSCLGLYSLSRSLYDDRWRLAGIYAGVSFYALALLTHYDGILIAPFAVYLLLRWFKSHPELPVAARLSHIALPAALGLILLTVFYIPMFAHSSDGTQAYWLGRITGGSTDAALLPSSIVTFQLYNPLFALPVYIGLGFLSLFQIKRAAPFWSWFLFPWFVLEVIVNDPGTHIYTYLLPAAVVASFGLHTLEQALTKAAGPRIGAASALILPVTVFGLLFSMSHFIFIDHTPEYPWEARRFLGMKLERPAEEYKLWVFGFPYNRHWEEIGEITSTILPDAKFATNENKSIAEFYVQHPFELTNADAYIHIVNPQSFRDRLADDKIRYWVKNYPPEKIFQNGDQVVAEIYLLPPGSLEQIRAAGY